MGKRQCVECGAKYTPKKYFQKYCGEECRTKVKERRMALPAAERSHKLEPRKCRVCGKEFRPRNWLHMTCNGCADEYHRQQSRERARKAYQARPLMKKKCAVCGAEFETRRSVQKYCSKSCHDKASGFVRSHRITAWEMMSLAKTLKAEAPVKRKANGKKTLEDWAREAREHHMNYGMYRAMVERGILPAQ